MLKQGCFTVYNQEPAQIPEQQPPVHFSLQQFYQFVQSQQSEHLFILFNSANHPQLPQQYYALEPQQQYIGLLQNLLEGYNEQSIPVMPYLTEVKRHTVEQNPFIHWLFSNPGTRSSFFAVSSNFDLSTVASHWNSIAQAHNSRQQIVILRLFDGRISKKFLAQISPSEREQLMGPCHCLWFPNESGDASMVNNCSCKAVEKTAPWFHLSAQHEALLAGGSNNSLRYNLSLYLWENHTETLSQHSPEITEQLIDLGLKKALTLGFTLPSSICQCVALFFDCSPIFYRQKEIRKLWTQPASEHEQLLLLSERITLQQWQQIARQAKMDDWMDIPDTPVKFISDS